MNTHEEKPFDFRATIDEEAQLTIYAEDEVLSQKKISKTGQRSHFTYEGEKITWICEIVKYRGRINRKTKIILVYLYPINLNYTNNPLEVEFV